MPPTLALEVLHRLPLAEATLLLWRFVCEPPVLEDLFQRQRGRCYTDTLAFPVLVDLIGDALLEHGGSGRQSFQRGRANGELTVSDVSAYGKLSRLPQAVSEAFLAEGTDRLQSVLAPQATVAMPKSLRSFAVTVLDGKAIKRVPKRLRPLRQASGGVLGGKALVALDLANGLALAMATALDGDANDASLVQALVPRVQARRPALLWLGDRQFCDLTQTRAFASRPQDHFLVRYHPRTTFCPDATQPTRTGQDEHGRTYVEAWGWLGAERNPERRYVRRITLQRPGEAALILITDLTDATLYPAAELLTAYRLRWSIERVFQQITEVFELRHLIGTTPQGTLFQLAFCLLLYNMLQVIRGYVAADGQQDSTAVSTELLFEDVRRQMIALHETLDTSEIVPLVPQALTAAWVCERLRQVLTNVWTERWRKAPPKKLKKLEWKASQRTHCSAYRILMEDRLARKAKPRSDRRP